jgi:hypothetical protein
MNFRKSAGKMVIAIALLGGALTASIGTAVAAEPGSATSSVRYISVSSAGSCDTTTGEWVVTWSMRNDFNQAATVSDVTALPTPVTGMPDSIEAGHTATATQRIPGNSNAALTFTATWADGQTSLVQWEFRPRHQPCNKAA